jgi:RNA polymerase sigma-70 factor (ECF subfamily)
MEPIANLSNRTGEVTEILRHLKHGESEHWPKLIPIVYSELKALAAAKMRREGPGHLLQPTALVHETYLRLVRQHGIEWKNRSHFFGVAAHLMRLILVDCARARNRAGRLREQSPLIDSRLLAKNRQEINLNDLDEALNKLKKLDPRQAAIVEMRYFGGLTVEQTAEALDISPRTVKREWAVARAWLHGELKHTTP